MKKVVLCGVILISIAWLFSCNKKDYKAITHDPDLYCKTMHELNYVIIYDIFKNRFDTAFPFFPNPILLFLQVQSTECTIVLLI